MKAPMKTSLSLFAALFLVWSGSVLAQSQQKAPTRNLHSACDADVKKFCASVQPGEHRIANCIRENQSKLSQPCRDAIAARQKRSGSSKASQGKAPS
jgi:arylformamidase